MRKPTKTSLKRRLDKLVSEIVRKKGKCDRCGGTNCLQTAHIFSRRYLGLRWSLDNVLCLCASCHFYFHANPVFFLDWLVGYLGQEKLDLLKEARNVLYKPSLEDLQIKLNILREMTNNPTG